MGGCELAVPVYDRFEGATRTEDGHRNAFLALVGAAAPSGATITAHAATAVATINLNVTIPPCSVRGGSSAGTGRPYKAQPLEFKLDSVLVVYRRLSRRVGHGMVEPVNLSGRAKRLNSQGYSAWRATFADPFPPQGVSLLAVSSR